MGARNAISEILARLVERLSFLAVFLPSTVAFAQEARPLAKGQTLYLPIYSHMLYGNLGKSGKASTRIAVDPGQHSQYRHQALDAGARLPGISILQANCSANACRRPTVVPPLGTLELFVELNDASGGSGANFIIKWDAEQPVNPPLVESLHVNMDGGKAVIFMTQSVPLTE